MGTTLATIRAHLNDEIDVSVDASDTLFTLSARNSAIGDGYAALWRAGVWKPVIVDLASVASQQYYAITGIRELAYVEVLDTGGVTIDRAPATLLPDGAGGYKLQVPALAAGFTIRSHGWTAYVSTFASDSAEDDLEVEYGRIPLLKAKAILYRSAMAKFVRYQERQTLPSEFSLTPDQLIGLIAACEREWADETKALAKMRRRYAGPALLLPGV